MKRSLFITGRELDKYLSDFAKATESSSTIKYSRIDYPSWRAIRGIAKDYNFANITVEQIYEHYNTISDIIVEIIPYNYTGKEKYLNKKITLHKDNGFAQWLLDKYAMNWPYAEDNAISSDVENSIFYPNNQNKFTYSDYEYSIINDSTVGATVNVDYATTSATSALDELSDRLTALENKNIKKEKNEMNATNFVNFEFGPVRDRKIRMSMYGFAIPNAEGQFVSYDKAGDRLMNVDILNVNADGWFFKIPKALKDIIVGDVVFHGKTPVFVKETLVNKLLVVDPASGEEKTVLPAHSPFGFDYITTLVGLADSFGGAEAASEDNPFGGMLPLLLLGNGDNMNSNLPLMLALSGGRLDMNNPMLMLALMGNQNGSGMNFGDLGTLMLMQNFMPKAKSDN